jgi:hypothetical protein
MKSGIVCQEKTAKVSNPPVMGSKGSIRREYFKSFIKRIIEILWATIAIPKRSGLRDLQPR